MSSGYFPIDRDSEKGILLKIAANNIKEVTENMWEAVGELDCSEDAAYDGACLAELNLAKKLILGVLREEKPITKGD